MLKTVNQSNQKIFLEKFGNQIQVTNGVHTLTCHKDYIWNEKTKSWKLAVVIYQKDQPVVVENTRQQNIEQEIEKYYQKKELERLQQADQQVQPIVQPVAQPTVQQRPKVVFDNPILNRYNM
ncbi:Hypothetical_protein [Hexamita inflata]|uniref:Hypothetical_protein n=1 Tax=Hexamita inflata TaxID=28002 RepID=A0AA86PW82_9EUKA|nr:Hypothetical protein HINF_LOCUS29274 [Hexamita inflata]